MCGSDQKPSKIPRWRLRAHLGSRRQVSGGNHHREWLLLHARQQTSAKRRPVPKSLPVPAQYYDGSACEVDPEARRIDPARTFAAGTESFLEIKDQRLSAADSHDLGSIDRAGVTPAQVAMQPETRPGAMQIRIEGLESSMDIVRGRDKTAVQSRARRRRVRDEEVDGRHLPQKSGDLPFRVMVRSIFLVEGSASAAAQSQTAESNGARVQTFETDALLRIMVSGHTQQRNAMRHKGDIVERAFIDIAERHDEVCTLPARVAPCENYRANECQPTRRCEAAAPS